MIRTLCVGIAFWMGDEPVVLLGVAQACVGFSLISLSLSALLAPPVQPRFSPR